MIDPMTAASLIIIIPYLVVYALNRKSHNGENKNEISSKDEV